jgi:hypothetical protein
MQPAPGEAGAGGGPPSQLTCPAAEGMRAPPRCHARSARWVGCCRTVAAQCMQHPSRRRRRDPHARPQHLAQTQHAGSGPPPPQSPPPQLQLLCTAAALEQARLEGPPALTHPSGRPLLPYPPLLPRPPPPRHRYWLYPKNMPVRPYQFDMAAAALRANTLVALPTGLGKTFVAAVVMLNYYRWFPEVGRGAGEAGAQAERATAMSSAGGREAPQFINRRRSPIATDHPSPQIIHCHASRPRRRRPSPGQGPVCGADEAAGEAAARQLPRDHGRPGGCGARTARRLAGAGQRPHAVTNTHQIIIGAAAAAAAAAALRRACGEAGPRPAGIPAIGRHHAPAA